MHNTIQLTDLSLSFSHKICFENFSAHISFGDRIAIIGRNGSGKSSLLKIIAGQNTDISLAYVPQIIEDFDSLSGGEKFNKSLSNALSKNPSLLLLDEPTNHLDLQNRKGLMRMLASFYGTLIVVTHDKEFLRNCIDILWHIDDKKITIFHGNYDNYVNELSLKRSSLLHQMELLKHEKKSIHQNLMNEQNRVAKSKSAGEKKVANKKWMKSVGDIKAMKSEKSQGNKLKSIDNKKKELSEELSKIRIPETIVPKFHLPNQYISDKTIVSIIDGSVRYFNKIILQNINLSVMSRERIALVGNNGSGKTTLVKAILCYENIQRSGDWSLLNPKNIGHLDQHYRTLNLEKSAVEIISDLNPSWHHAEVRKHLNDFLFRKNEEVNTAVKNLSGGEKARLSLAKIAASPPKLLILDEITNNIDLETRDHVVEILQNYPGAMIVISHDEDFLKEIKIEKYYEI